MVWKISKHKRSDRQGRIRKQRQQSLESQPILRSCLKTTKNVTQSSSDFFRAQDNLSSKNRSKELSTKSATSRGGRSLNSTNSVDVGSKGSGNSSLSFAHRKRIASVDVHSDGSRSWDHESRKSENSRKSEYSRKSETAQSIQNSEQSSQDSTSQVKEKNEKHVRFEYVYVRDYERVVGDNPSCTIGPPVGIGWNYGETRRILIDSFEATKTYHRSVSRLVLSREAREALLINWGASFHDIVESVRGNLKIKNQRRQTITNLGKVERIEEAFESATRKLKSALLLRRSTGNKVKRLQEQANLAQSALASLKMAEDAALDEIRGNSCGPISEEPTNQDDFNGFPITQYGPPSSDRTEPSGSRIIIPEKDDLPSKRYSFTGNSTTQSELEIERFHMELELEMFGDDELPSMVGQTLELSGTGYRSEESSVNSGMTERYSRDGIEEELLEKEQNRSMISQYLLEDPDNAHLQHELDLLSPEHDGLNDIYNYSNSQPIPPPHTDQINTQQLSAWNGLHPKGGPWAMEQEQPDFSRSQTIPLHAGMTMFEDCALLGGRNDKHFHRKSRRRSSRKRDLNAGPKVQYMPPPNQFGVSHCMDGSDSHGVSTRLHDTIIIEEDDYAERMMILEGDPFLYNRNIFPSWNER